MNEKPMRGVLIYVKDNIKSSAHVLSKNNFEEMVCCKIHLRQGDKLVICYIYRSPNSDRENNSLPLQLLETLTDSKPSHLLILGDFNYRNIDWLQKTARSGAGKDTSMFMEKLISEDLHQNVKDWTQRDLVNSLVFWI